MSEYRPDSQYVTEILDDLELALSCAAESLAEGDTDVTEFEIRRARGEFARLAAYWRYLVRTVPELTR